MCKITYINIPDCVIKDIISLPTNVRFTKNVIAATSTQTKNWCSDNNFSLKFVWWSYHNTNQKIEIHHCQFCGNPLTESQMMKSSKWCCVSCKNHDPLFQQLAYQRLIETTGGQFGFKNKKTRQTAVQTKTKRNWPELDNSPKYINNTYTIPSDIIDLLTTCCGQDGRVKREAVNTKITIDQRQWFANNNTNIPILSYFLFKLKTDVVCPQYCIQCGNPIPISTLILGGKMCSKKCAQKQGSQTWSKIRKENPELAHDVYQQRNEKLQQTNLERYGVPVASQNEHVRSKIKQTCLERYGTEHAISSKYAQEKARQTCQAKYGTDYYIQTDDFNIKSRHTCLEKYGVEYYSSTYQGKHQRKQTCLEKYGFENAAQSDEVKSKIRSTSQERYGANTFLTSPLGKEKTATILLERYGAETILINDERSKRIAIENALAKSSYKFDNIDPQDVDVNVGLYRINNVDNIYDQFAQRNISILSSYNDFICQREVSYRCNLCGHEWKSFSTSWTKVNCPICCTRMRSIQESDFCNMIQNVYSGEVVSNTRKVLSNGKEIDVWLPELKIGFEFDGVFWHNDQHLDDDYHYEKKILALNQGINLVHIFSNFWETKQQVVMQTVKKILGRYQLVSKCIVEEVLDDDVLSFINNNSLALYDNIIRYAKITDDVGIVAVGIVVDDYLHIIEDPNIKLSEEAIISVAHQLNVEYVALDANLYDNKWWQHEKMKYKWFTSCPHYYTKGHDVVTIGCWKKLDIVEQSKWSKLYNCGLFLYRV